MLNLKKQITWTTGVIAFAGIEYLVILGAVFWAVWFHSTGESGDMPFELWLVWLGTLEILAGLTGAGVVYETLHSRESQETARKYAALSAMLVPLFSCFIPAVMMKLNAGSFLCFVIWPLILSPLIIPAAIIAFRKQAN